MGRLKLLADSATPNTRTARSPAAGIKPRKLLVAINCFLVIRDSPLDSESKGYEAGIG
jgi:hypothetical protein